MSMSDVFVQAVIDHWFVEVNSTALSGDTTVYLGLSTADPLDDGSGIAEPATSAGYTRVNIGDTSSIGWAITLGVAKNSTEINFPIATASWGTITHWFIATSGTRGVAPDRYFEVFGTSQTIGANERLTLPVNFFDLGTIDNGTFSDMHSTAYVDDQILKSMLRNTAATVAATFIGVHSFPFFAVPNYSPDPFSFGEVWDAIANTGYLRTVIIPEDGFFAGFTNWENHKAGGVHNVGTFLLPPFTTVDFGFSSKSIIILDSAGSDPGGSSDPGSGGGNLLFWAERANLAAVAIGDVFQILLETFDITLDV
jgi:hypothetical protein